MDFIQANWLLVLIALVIAVAIAWYVFHASRRTRITSETRDVLDEGAAPAARNQALIDSAPAAAVKAVDADPASPVATAPIGLAGAGIAVEAGALAESVEAARQASVHGDDLTRIKGVGPRLADQLRTLGIASFAEIAGWSAQDIARIDPQLGRFQGRIERDNWVEQARYLAEGDIAEFETRFGKVT